jgi:DNA-binding response OmpR family regulator
MNICPNCSYDLRQDRKITQGDFTLDPRGQITYQGNPVKLTKVQRCMMLTLAKEDGRTVEIDALGERCCYSESRKTVRSHLSILRRKLEKQGVPVPFRNDWDVGYYWEV